MMINIEKIIILNYHMGKLCCDCEGSVHNKTLPILSVVQADVGAYDISIENGKSFSTGEKGAFIAPSNVIQHIIHHNNPEKGYMQARWIFLEVVINDRYSLDELYEFPVLLPSEYNDKVCEIFDGITENDNICNIMSKLYKLVDILMTVGTQREEIDEALSSVTEYIKNNYVNKIEIEDIAKIMCMSIPGVYRYFKKKVGISPANYINDLRLRYASALLINSDCGIAEIAEKAGLYDVSYFYKLFKRKHGMSPSGFRRLNNYAGYGTD